MVNLENLLGGGDFWSFQVAWYNTEQASLGDKGRGLLRVYTKPDDAVIYCTLHIINPDKGFTLDSIIAKWEFRRMDLTHKS